MSGRKVEEKNWFIFVGNDRGNLQMYQSDLGLDSLPRPVY